MEILDLYDDSFQKLDETIERGTKTEAGKNIMLSVAFIKNQKGEYLIQKTSSAKGSKYSSTGGHVKHGEDGLTTIKRELQEELGLLSDDIKYITTFKYPLKNCIFNVYLLEVKDLDLKSIKLQEEEVAEIMFLTPQEINNLIKEDKFLASHAYIFQNYLN